ncbi:hypothetical protein ABZV75_19520 [Streptomyces flaveolus]|uniref:hypothetical protein n=1 Tax=Streptomyces flaveolus TaxID=67297 RepID=UPI0033AFB69E
MSTAVRVVVLKALTGTSVAARPEGETLRLPAEPEPVRLGEDTRITVGRAEQHEDDGAARHGRTRDAGVHQSGAGAG